MTTEKILEINTLLTFLLTLSLNELNKVAQINLSKTNIKFLTIKINHHHTLVGIPPKNGVFSHPLVMIGGEVLTVSGALYDTYNMLQELFLKFNEEDLYKVNPELELFVDREDFEIGCDAKAEMQAIMDIFNSK